MSDGKKHRNPLVLAIPQAWRDLLMKGAADFGRQLGQGFRDLDARITRLTVAAPLSRLESQAPVVEGIAATQGRKVPRSPEVRRLHSLADELTTELEAVAAWRRCEECGSDTGTHAEGCSLVAMIERARRDL